MTKDEALKMAIDALELINEHAFRCGLAQDALKACKKALEHQSASEIAELEDAINLHKATIEFIVGEHKKDQAHINVLREALNAMRDTFDIGGDVTSAENNALHKADKALSSTPAQSLQAHDNEVIERCAKIFEGAVFSYDYREIAIAIRALKGKL